MIYFALVFFWPLIDYLSININKINESKELIIISTIIFSLSLISFLFSKLVSKCHPDRMILPIFGAVALFFNYGHLVDFIGKYNRAPLSASLFYGILFCGLSLFFWKIAVSNNVRKFSKILICFVLILPSVHMVKKIFNNEDKSLPSHFIETGDTLQFNFLYKPNIYYILVDAYARQDTLEEVFGYSNEPLLEHLEKNDFIVSRNSRSNYHFTVASLSASMNMEYHKISDGKVAYSQMQSSLRGDNKVRGILRSNGYEIVNIPAHWTEIGCFGNEDVCIRGNNFEIYESFLSQTPLRKFKFPNDYVTFATLKNSVFPINNRPKFIFAHLAQIHDAVFDESGKFHSALHPCFSDKKDGSRYLSSIKAMNLQIIRFIKEVRLIDPQAIIIIQADHGPSYVGNQVPNNAEYWLKHYDSMRLNSNNDFRYTFGILSAIYLPNYHDNEYKQIKKYFSGAFTLVNTFRYIFAYLSEKQPDLLPEKSHFLYYDKAEQAYKEANIDHLIN